MASIRARARGFTILQVSSTDLGILMVISDIYEKIEEVDPKRTLHMSILKERND